MDSPLGLVARKAVLISRFVDCRSEECLEHRRLVVVAPKVRLAADPEDPQFRNFEHLVPERFYGYFFFQGPD